MPDKVPLTTEDANRITKELLEKVIGNEPYKHSDVGAWNNEIVNGVINQLANNDPDVKYIVTCTVVQKNGAGLNSSTTCYWNNARDQWYVVRWENKYLHCLVHIYCITLKAY